MTKLTPVPVPEAVRAIAADWHGGQGSALYAIASTSGLTPSHRWASDRDPIYWLDTLERLWQRLSSGLLDPIAADDIDPIYREMAEDVAWFYGELSAAASS